VRITLATLSALLTIVGLALPVPAQTRLAPYVATPPDVVDRMLQLARVGPADVVYDLGSGDGRIVITAAQKFGARGVGIDIDPILVERANASAAAAGVADRVTFRVQDALTVNVSDATVVTLYMLAAANVQLRPILMRDLRPGARVVSHNFHIGDWQPEVIDNFVDQAGTKRTLYLWNIR
jgi:protein-L-isoaspartate O-methyltransferase